MSKLNKRKITSTLKVKWKERGRVRELTWAKRKMIFASTRVLKIRIGRHHKLFMTPHTLKQDSWKKDAKKYIQLLFCDSIYMCIERQDGKDIIR